MLKHCFLLYQSVHALYKNYSSAPTTKLFIDGEFRESKTTNFIELYDPATNNLVTNVPQTTQSEMEEAVQSAKKAYASWRQTSVLSRQQLMLKLQAAIRRDMKKLAANITLEQGKTLVDAEGDVMRGLRKLINLPVTFGVIQKNVYSLT